MYKLFLLLRPRHWSKNLFLYIPLFFAGDFFVFEKFIQVSYGIIIFSIISSGIYVLNDIKDVDLDRRHPKKKYRPLASGAISLQFAFFLSVFLILAGLVSSFFLNIHFFIFVAAYLSLNVAYSLGLKHIAIVDLFIVASGFVFRVFSGGVLAEVPVSHWLIIMILLLSLFLVIAKRLEDIKLSDDNSIITRKSTGNYNADFIYSCLTMLSAVMIVAYIMYTLSDEVTGRFETDYLFITCVFVIAGMMRYLQKTIVEKDSSSPVEALYKDRFILFTILGWLLSFFVIIYLT